MQKMYEHIERNFKTVTINKPSLGSFQASKINWAWSVQPFKHTEIQSIYIDQICKESWATQTAFRTRIEKTSTELDSYKYI